MSKQCETKGCKTPAEDVRAVYMRAPYRATVFLSKPTKLCKPCRKKNHGNYALVK